MAGEASALPAGSVAITVRRCLPLFTRFSFRFQATEVWEVRWPSGSAASFWSPPESYSVLPFFGRRFSLMCVEAGLTLMLVTMTLGGTCS